MSECTPKDTPIPSCATIGSHVKIQNSVSVYEGVELEDYVFCGPAMVFTNILEPRSRSSWCPAFPKHIRRPPAHRKTPLAVASHT